MNRRDLLQGLGLSTLAATQALQGAAAAGAHVPAPGEPWQWNAVDIVAAVRRRQVSCREVTESCLARLKRVNAKINAIVDYSEDEALAGADEADRQMRTGAPAGTLHGVPVTTKIMTDQRGHATSSGAVALKNKIAKEDGTSVNNLRNAGAVMLGRSNSSTFGTRWFTENDLYGRTLNPWNPAVTPGGSSGGAATSVAVGITPIAQCTDGMGSTRIPAYACGIAGVRPTLGRVPGANPSQASRPRAISTQLIDVEGLVARRVRDLRLALAVTSRGDIRDPWWVPAAPLAPMRKPIKVALFDHAEGFAIDPAVASGLKRAAAALDQAGYVVEPATPPSFHEITPLLFSMVFNENREHRAQQVQQYGDEKSKKAMAFFSGMTPSADLAAFSNAMGRREELIVAWKMFLQDHPIILMPPCWSRPCPQDYDQQSQSQFATMIDALTPTFCGSLLGLPSVVVPTGVIDGLPTGVEILADQFREDVCFDAAEAIEAAVSTPTPIDPLA